MQTLEFGQRFLNYKALVKIINNHNGAVEHVGLFMDCPYRILKFTDIAKTEIDQEESALVLYVSSNNTMFYNTSPHFIESP